MLDEFLSAKTGSRRVPRSPHGMAALRVSPGRRLTNAVDPAARTASGPVASLLERHRAARRVTAEPLGRGADADASCAASLIPPPLVKLAASPALKPRPEPIHTSSPASSVGRRLQRSPGQRGQTPIWVPLPEVLFRKYPLPLRPYGRATGAGVPRRSSSSPRRYVRHPHLRARGPSCASRGSTGLRPLESAASTPSSRVGCGRLPQSHRSGCVGSAVIPLELHLLGLGERGREEF